MRCYRCGGTALSRASKDLPPLFRKARAFQDVIFRRHRCLDCGALLTSIQKILDVGTAEDMEAKWLDAPAPAPDLVNWDRYGREYSAGSPQAVADLADGGASKVG